MIGMPSAARNSLIGGYTLWSEPRTSCPRRFSSAASVAIAVPQMPIRWMTRDPGSGIRDSLAPGEVEGLPNWRFLDDDRRTRRGDNAHADAERERPARAGRVA